MVSRMKKKTTRRKINKVEVVTPPPPSTSKNMMGLSGIIMILLTNYQTEIKKTFEMRYGFLK